MLDPVSLFSFDSPRDPRTIRSRVLVVSLGSYADAGRTQALLDHHLVNTLPSHKLGHFDVDQLFDYTGHRPPIVFDHDHFRDYTSPEIVLHQITDANNKEFLLLSGPEPALQWERMVAAITHCMDQFNVEVTLLVQGIPTPAPHTRPVFVSEFAGRPGLVSADATFTGTFQMRSSFGGLLSQRLGDAGRNVFGLVAHIPNYLADNEYPDGAIALIHGLKESAGLEIPLRSLPTASATVRAQIDAQVAESADLQQMISQLEYGYEQFMQGRRHLTTGEQALPTAEEIGREVEDFLRGLDGSINGDPTKEDPTADGPDWQGTGSAGSPKPDPSSD